MTIIVREKIYLLSIIFIFVSYRISNCQNLEFALNGSVTESNLEKKHIPIIVENDYNSYLFKYFTNSSTGKVGGTFSSYEFYFRENWEKDYLTQGFVIENRLNLIICRNDRYMMSLSDKRLSRQLFRGIYASKYNKGSWSKLEKIKLEGINTSKIHSFFINKEIDLILFSYNESTNQNEDLYISEFRGSKWTTPINLGNTINTNGREITPFLSNDKKYIFFSSNGHKGYGSQDIFVSERLYNSWELWSKPTNLGPEVNSEGFESYFILTPQQEAYVLSNKKGYADIYNFNLLESEINRDNRRYYSDLELLEIFDINVKVELSFVENTIGLSPSSKELLWFIANKIIENDEVNILINAGIPDNETYSKEYLNSARAEIIKDYLLSLGINEQRVAIEKSKGDDIKIRFYDGI